MLLDDLRHIFGADLAVDGAVGIDHHGGAQEAAIQRSEAASCRTDPLTFESGR
jgi:hypothetical protein